MKNHCHISRITPGLFLLIFLGLMPFFDGCAAIPVSLVAEGADAGIGLTTGNARSFTYPRAQVQAASLQALSLMQISVTENEEHGETIKIHGKTKHLKISLTLATITPTLTKVSVKAERGWIAKDATVEAEILLQINRAINRGRRTGSQVDTF